MRGELPIVGQVVMHVTVTTSTYAHHPNLETRRRDSGLGPIPAV